MDGTDVSPHALTAAVGTRSAQIIGALGALDNEALGSASELPHWSRLTIACHLRYGAAALRRMTTATLAGAPASYYPEGRDEQRPSTLVPIDGESPVEVVSSVAATSDGLGQLWSSLGDEDWDRPIVEPADNPDLGSLPLASLPLLRLTEVEVHGLDLGLGLPDWSELFVSAVLPTRLRWLNVRRANHRHFDATLEGSWLLVARDGPSYRIEVTGATVESVPADRAGAARAVIEASSRDLLALLLGRPFLTPPRLSGDVAFARAFADAFPGP